MSENAHSVRQTVYICIAIVLAVVLAIFLPSFAMRFELGGEVFLNLLKICLLYTSDAADD